MSMRRRPLPDRTVRRFCMPHKGGAHARAELFKSVCTSKDALFDYHSLSQTCSALLDPILVQPNDRVPWGGVATSNRVSDTLKVNGRASQLNRNHRTCSAFGSLCHNFGLTATSGPIVCRILGVRRSGGVLGVRRDCGSGESQCRASVRAGRLRSAGP
jgi:hypothetical protein